MWGMGRYQKDFMYYVEIGLCAQNIDTILGSIANTIGEVYVIIEKVREFSLWTQITFTSLSSIVNIIFPGRTI